MVTGKISFQSVENEQSEEIEPDLVRERILYSIQEHLPCTVSRKLRHLIYLMLQKTPSKRPTIPELLQSDIFNKTGFEPSKFGLMPVY